MRGDGDMNHEPPLPSIFHFLEVCFRDVHPQENAWFVSLANAMVFVFMVFKYYGIHVSF